MRSRLLRLKELKVLAAFKLVKRSKANLWPCPVQESRNVASEVIRCSVIPWNQMEKLTAKAKKCAIVSPTTTTS